MRADRPADIRELLGEGKGISQIKVEVHRANRLYSIRMYAAAGGLNAAVAGDQGLNAEKWCWNIRQE